MAGGAEPGRSDLDAFGEQLGLVAEDLRRSADQMRQAIEDARAGEYTASSPDERVQVTVDGRCRVTSVSLHAYLLRETPQAVDEVLTATLNEALGQARAGGEQALLDALPPHLRSGVAQMRRTAGE